VCPPQSSSSSVFWDSFAQRFHPPAQQKYRIWRYEQPLAPRNSASEAAFFWKSNPDLDTPDGLFRGAPSGFRWLAVSVIYRAQPAPIFPVLAAITRAEVAICDHPVGESHFDFDFRNKVDGVLTAAIDPSVAFCRPTR